MDQYGWIGFVASLAALIWYLYSQRSKEGRVEVVPAKGVNDAGPVTSAPTSRILLASTLQKLNIEYELDKDGDYFITYHGERFLLIVNEKDTTLYIKDYYWYSSALDDIDNLSVLHRAINECNSRCLSTLIYQYFSDENEVGVHSKRDLLWIPQIPDKEKYLRDVLDDMLKMHNYFFRWIEEIRHEKHAETNQ